MAVHRSPARMMQTHGPPTDVPDCRRRCRIERVIVWLQNSHAIPIPAGAMSLDRMGADAPVPPSTKRFPHLPTYPLDVSEILPGVNWPSQIELRTGRHIVRPRYEVRRNGRTRIAHLNVERSDLRDRTRRSGHCRRLWGADTCCRFRYCRAPNFEPSCSRLPWRWTSWARRCASTFSTAWVRRSLNGSLGCCRAIVVWPSISTMFSPRTRCSRADTPNSSMTFATVATTNGWLHALFRYEQRATGHAAESSFGGHIFNTVMTYKGEPQSYNGPPPGVSTKLFLKLGLGGTRSFSCSSIRPRQNGMSVPARRWIVRRRGQLAATQRISISCFGWRSFRLYQYFRRRMKLLEARMPVRPLIKHPTCQAISRPMASMTQQVSISFDHMFGFSQLAMPKEAQCRPHDPSRDRYACSSSVRARLPLRCIFPVLARLRDKGEIVLALVCDLQIERAAEARRQFGFLQESGDGIAALHRSDIDAVYIFGSAQLHYEYGMTALRNGKRLFVEKPIAPTYSDARNMGQAALDRGSVAVGGLNRRFFKSLAAVRARAGKTGWRLAEAVFHKPEFRKPPLFGARTWLGANGIHAFDALIFMMGAMSDHLTALTAGSGAAQPSAFSALMRWRDGSQAVFLSQQ